MIGVELAWLKINVPTDPGKYRHTCPWCGPKRTKSYERSIAVTVHDARRATVWCHHCHISMEVSAK